MQQTESFILSSKEPYILSNLSVENILLLKIGLKDQNHGLEELFHSIRIETTFPNGSIHRDVLAPLSYFSPMAKGKETDEPINSMLKDCNITTMQIILENSDKIIEYKVTYLPIKPSKWRLDEAVNIESIESMYFNLANDSSISAQLSLPLLFNNKGFFEVASNIQLISSWFRKYYFTKIILPIGQSTERDVITAFFDEEPNYVSSILGWNNEIYDAQGNNSKQFIRKYTTDIRSQMNSISDSSRLLQKGSKLFLTCFDHFGERGGFLNSFYVNRNKFFSPDSFEFSPFVERLSYFAQGFSRELAKNNITPIFQDITQIIYELMLNTHEWARTDENNKELTPNVRGVYLKLHKASKSTYVNNTKKYHGLNRYFNNSRFSSNSKELYFLEISVFDSGPGFIKRYASSNVDAIPIEEQVKIIKRCLTSHNTSAEGEKGIMKGIGLDKVLQILDNKGFLRIRTGKCSLYRDLTKDRYIDVSDSDEIKLNDWRTNSNSTFSEMSNAEGALISIIYPYDL